MLHQPASGYPGVEVMAPAHAPGRFNLCRTGFSSPSTSMGLAVAVVIMAPAHVARYLPAIGG